MPSALLQVEVPLRHLKPDTHLLTLPPQVFGCVAFVQDLSPSLDKLFPRSIKCIFMEYSRIQRGYRCFHPPIRRYFVLADDTFFKSMCYSDESQPPVESILLPSVVEPLYLQCAYGSLSSLAGISPMLDDTGASHDCIDLLCRCKSAYQPFRSSYCPS